MQVSRSSERILWIDLAKTFGMILVFYGHFIERWIYTFHSDAALAPQYKLIYSFHMPLFFILSGYVASNANVDIKSFFLKQLNTRLVPVLFFNIVAIPLWILCYSYEGTKINSVSDFSFMFIRTFLAGHPEFNKITWFLICLMMAEIINYFIVRYIDKRYYYIFSLAVLVLGFVIVRWIAFITYSTGVMQNFWYIHESLIAFGLFAIGRMFRNIGLISRKLTSYRIIMFIFFTLITLLTYNLNDKIVNMWLSVHGNPIYFIIPAVCGALSVMLCSSLVPNINAVTFIGRNSLFFMGINGVYLEFINHRIIALVSQHLPDKFAYVTLASCLITCACLASCYPVVLVLNNIYPIVINITKLNVANRLTFLLGRD